jgi:hypothetical protein
MHRCKHAVIAGLVAALSFASVGCREEGPAERAGRALDEAAEDAEEGLRNLTGEEGAFERAGEEADEAIEKARQATRDALE